MLYVCQCHAYRAQCQALWDPTVLFLYIQIPDRLGMCLDEPLPRVDRVAHQHVEGAVGFGGVVHGDQQQGAVDRVHGRLQIGRAHV